MKQPGTFMLAWAAMFGLGAAPAFGQEIPQVEFEKYELANGLDVILYVDQSTPIVSVNIWYHVGSGNEEPGRSGFAHLFEHMMFQGSEHHQGEYFEPLQRVGASVNGSTNFDRTNYYEDLPSNQLELALWLESDRMGFLLPAMTEEKFENQRDVVKNERRQNYENRPYRMWVPLTAEMLFPADHPYSWPTIGSQRDLTAASLDDVKEFFQMYYTPNNAALVIAGDVHPDEAKALVEKYFGSIPPGPAVQRITDWSPELSEPVQMTYEDDVELPRVYYAWHTPGYFKPGDAEFDLISSLLTTGKTSRLYSSLVYEQEIAQDVGSMQWSREMGSVFLVWATAAPGQSLDEVERALDVELAMLLSDGITETELRNAQTAWRTRFVRNMERVGGRGGIANRLNTYNRYLGDPGMFEFDFNRYADATRESLLEYSRRQLVPNKRATLRIVPRGDYTVVASELDRSVMPAGGPEPSFSPPAIQTAELSNGLQVMLVEDHSLPLVQTQLVIRSGYSADPSGTPGAASLTAELLDEGTTSRSALELDEEERRLGAQLSTRSNFDGSFVTLNVLKSSLDDGMTLMSDVVLNPAFPEEELERQRRIYVGRIAQESKQARASALRTFYLVLYGEEHPYGQPPSGTGTLASIQAITRDDLVAFYGANYKPNNSALVFAGDLTFAEAKALAEKYFGRWQRGMVTMPDLAEPEPITGTQVYIVDKPGAAQTMIVAGHLGLKRSDSDYRAIQVMNNTLGGKFTSRINLNLREDKGYTYGARSVFVTRRETGPFLVIAPVQAFSTKESVVEILRELRDVVGERPISAQEAAEARDNIIKGFPRQFETLGGVTSQLSTIFMYDLPLDEWDRYATEIAAITAELASQAARDRINPEALLIVLIGDREQIEPGIRELGLGEVRYFAASGEE